MTFWTYSLDYYLGDSSTESIRKASEKNARFAKEMYFLLQESINREEYVKVGYFSNQTTYRLPQALLQNDK